VNYLEFLKEWQSQAKSRMDPFLTSNTYVGFLVTLTSTLQIMEFLVDEHNFDFLMTNRLNQDTLEVGNNYFFVRLHIIYFKD